MSVSFLSENKTMQTIRARVAFHSRQHGFDKCMQQIIAADGSIPGSLIAELYAYWGDPLSTSDEGYLRSCIAELRNSEGPVLLCGASLMALVLGTMCDSDARKSKQVWCLEQDHHWANLMRSWLTEYRIGATHVIQSQPQLKEDYVWYSVDTSRLADSYQLVICDGARATPKGMIGTLKSIEGCLDNRFTMLARNVKELADLRTLNDWAKSHDAKFVLIDKQAGFVKLMRQPVALKETVPPNQAKHTQPPTSRTATRPAAVQTQHP
jgi:hypothetical protein